MLKKSILFVLKTILLTTWLTVVWAVGSRTLGAGASAGTLSPADQAFAGVALIVVSLGLGLPDRSREADTELLTQR